MPLLSMISSNLALVYLSPFSRYDQFFVEKRTFKIKSLHLTPNLKMFSLH